LITDSLRQFPSRQREGLDAIPAIPLFLGIIAAIFSSKYPAIFAIPLFLGSTASNFSSNPLLFLLLCYSEFSRTVKTPSF
jgi:hypothetical protein